MMQMHYPHTIRLTAEEMMRRKKEKSHKKQIVNYWFFMVEQVVEARDAGLSKPWVQPERDIYNLFNEIEKQELKKLKV